MSGLTHFDAKGDAHMVDVSAKAHTDRIAVAAGKIGMQPETLALVLAGTAKKGDVLGIARIAGIMATKRTHELIPLCHPLALTKVSVEFKIDQSRNLITIEATAKTSGQTGVEMEALTAVSVAALTIYDMLKAVDRAMTISGISLCLKDGGKSGKWQREGLENLGKQNETS